MPRVPRDDWAESANELRGEQTMSTSAIVMMVLICGVIWGGFVYFLIRAMRSEGRKQTAARADD